jgi:hypothetical protein
VPVLINHVTASISGVTIEHGSSLVGGGLSNFGTLTLANCASGTIPRAPSWAAASSTPARSI